MKKQTLVVTSVLLLLLQNSEGNTTQAVLCAGSGGLLLGVGVGLGYHYLDSKNMRAFYPLVLLQALGT